MARRSQTLAYRKIRSEGLLSRLRFKVYEIVFENQTDDGVTSGELDRLLSSRGAWTRSASPRLNELVKLGVLAELPLRKCRETGQTVIAYCTTGELPDNTALKRPTKAKLYLELRQAAQSLCDHYPVKKGVVWSNRRKRRLARLRMALEDLDLADGR